MKTLLLPLTMTALLCTANAYALKVSFRTGPSDAPAGEKFEYEVEYTRDDKDKKKKTIKKVEYLWSIVGEGFQSHDIATGVWIKDANVATVTMLNPEWMSADRTKWPKGTISCTVKITFRDKTEEANSARVEVTVVPNR